MNTPVKRFRCVLEYDGTDFVGWQIQNNGRSVQGVMEGALTDLFGMPTRITCAGRTDAGVHARGQVAHFDADTDLDPSTVLRALNARVPDDITLHTVGMAPPEFHARYSASSRSYRYRISRRRTSIDRRCAWIVYHKLDQEAISRAAASLIGTHDFTAFSKFVPDLHHHICHVFEARWNVGEEQSSLLIRANRFLHGMVRCIVGGLVDVARGRLEVEEFTSLIDSNDRAESPMLAPAHGLTLESVGYSEDDWKLVRTALETVKAGGQQGACSE